MEILTVALVFTLSVMLGLAGTRVFLECVLMLMRRGTIGQNTHVVPYN